LSEVLQTSTCRKKKTNDTRSPTRKKKKGSPIDENQGLRIFTTGIHSFNAEKNPWDSFNTLGVKKGDDEDDDEDEDEEE